MTKEQFNTIIENFKNLPINAWKMRHSDILSKDYITLKDKTTKISVRQDGRLIIDGIVQQLGYFQNRKMTKFYIFIESELATRYVQLKLDQV